MPCAWRSSRAPSPACSSSAWASFRCPSCPCWCSPGWPSSRRWWAWASAVRSSRCSPVWAAASSRRPPTWAPTSWARWRPAFPRTTRATPPSSPTTWATNVGDCAGMAADLFETYVVTTVAAMLIGNLAFGAESAAISLGFPVVIGVASIVASIIGTLFVKMGQNGTIMGALYKGLWISAVIAIVAFFPITNWMLGGRRGREHGARAGGRHAAVHLDLRRHWRGPHGGHGLHHRPLHLVREEAGRVHCRGQRFRPRHERHSGPCRGHGGHWFPPFWSSLWPRWRASFWAASSASPWPHFPCFPWAGIVVAIDSFGPVTDNAGGIAEMSGLPESVRENNRRARCGGQHHQGRDQGLRHRVGRACRRGACSPTSRTPSPRRRAPCSRSTLRTRSCSLACSSAGFCRTCSRRAP